MPKACYTDARRDLCKQTTLFWSCIWGQGHLRWKLRSSSYVRFGTRETILWTLNYSNIYHADWLNWKFSQCRVAQLAIFTMQSGSTGNFHHAEWFNQKFSPTQFDREFPPNQPGIFRQCFNWGILARITSFLQNAQIEYQAHESRSCLILIWILKHLYVPLRTATYRYGSLRTAAYRCLPLRTATYRYYYKFCSQIESPRAQ